MSGHQDRYEAAGEILAFLRMAFGVDLDLFTRPPFRRRCAAKGQACRSDQGHHAVRVVCIA